MNDLIKSLQKFRDDRDWQKYHTPKNLAMSIAIEAAELMEHYQWQDDPYAHDAFNPATPSQINDEVADIFIYLLNFCDVMGIDLVSAAKAKVEKNKAKYPVKMSFPNA